MWTGDREVAVFKPAGLSSERPGPAVSSSGESAIARARIQFGWPDAQLPHRLGAEYVGEDGAKHMPYMLHRAVLGSFERFIGIMIENYAGAFPLWLAPVQAVVATITSDADGYAEEVAAKFRAAGLRVETDLRNEKVGYKVREHSVGKVPVIAVVGRKEAEEGKVALRRLGSQAQEILTVEEAIRVLTEEATPPDLKRG
mgnify:CR=1 FL=1